MSMRNATLEPRKLFLSFHKEKLPQQGGLSNVATKNSCEQLQASTVHQGKVDPGVSELPLVNELSRNHVNRPLVSITNDSYLLVVLSWGHPSKGKPLLIIFLSSS